MANIKNFFSQLEQTFLSIAKIALQSRPCHKPPQAKPDNELVILGNGPSLNDTMLHHKDFLLSRHLLAVNFAACTPMFAELKPKFYMLTDPHFFLRLEQENVMQLWKVFANDVNWDMTLFIPTKVNKSGEWYSLVTSNKHISVSTYNMTPAEGFAWFENFIYSHRMGMPRPRNVLIPSLMQAISMRYNKVYLAGADHSWLKTLSVDHDNRVVSIQPHFYKEAKKEEDRIKKDYMNIPLHQVLESMYIAFRTYHTIRRYADHRGTEIINITPDSFIDAFPRLVL